MATLKNVDETKETSFNSSQLSSAKSKEGERASSAEKQNGRVASAKSGETLSSTDGKTNQQLSSANGKTPETLSSAKKQDSEVSSKQTTKRELPSRPVSRAAVQKNGGKVQNVKTGNVVSTGNTRKSAPKSNNKKQSDNAKKNWQRVDLKEVLVKNDWNENAETRNMEQTGALRPTAQRQDTATLTVPGSKEGTPGLHEENDGHSTGRESRLSIDSKRSASFFERLQNATVVQAPGENDRPKSVFTNNETYIKSAIPYLPQGLAVILLICNILVPGLGTFLCAFAIFCCGEPRIQTKDDRKMATCCINVFVAFAQLATVTFLLVGWFWSVSWGFNMVILAVKWQREKKEEHEKDLQGLTLAAFGSPVRTGGMMKHI